MTTDVSTTNLGINVLGYSEYDGITTKSNSELYVVKEQNADTDNAISSRTYADVGRDAVYYGPNTPTSPYTKIWIDTSDDMVLIQPASINMDNISETGFSNIQSMIAPNFSSASALSFVVGGTYTMPNTGWIYIHASTNSSIKLRYFNNTGSLLTDITTIDGKTSDKLFLTKGDVIYTETLSGSVLVTLYPCRSSI